MIIHRRMIGCDNLRQFTDCRSTKSAMPDLLLLWLEWNETQTQVDTVEAYRHPYDVFYGSQSKK